MLHNGLYEQIINKGLDAELSVTDSSLKLRLLIARKRLKYYQNMLPRSLKRG